MSKKSRARRSFRLGVAFAAGFAAIAWFFVYGDGRSIRPGMEDLVKAKSIYEEVIESFDEDRSGLKDSIDKGSEALTEFQAAILNAKNVHNELMRVSSRWGRIKEDNAHVKGAFEDLVEAADIFFSEVMSRAEMISDEALRRDTLKSINVKKESYIIALKNTKTSLHNLDEAYNQVSDMMIAVEVHYSMKMFDEKIDETLKTISSLVAQAMSDLALISDQSKALLNLGS